MTSLRMALLAYSLKRGIRERNKEQTLKVIVYFKATFLT